MTLPDRPSRVAEEFRQELSALVARGLKDPRVKGFVTVTGARMSPDLKEVVVWVSIHGGEKVRQETFAGLASAAPFLQRQVARRLKLRHTPHLRFRYDESVAEGDKIDRLLREVRDKEGW